MPTPWDRLEALADAGRIAEGLAVLVGGIEQSEAGWLTPELLRVKGELFLLQSSAAVRETAEDLFRQALDAARRDKALSWELRAAMSLARLLILRAGQPTGWQFSSQSTNGSPRGSTPRILNR